MAKKAEIASAHRGALSGGLADPSDMNSEPGAQVSADPGQTREMDPGRIAVGESLDRASHDQGSWNNQALHQKHGDAWTPPTLLDAPPPRPGYEQQWVRTKVFGQDDAANIALRAREGWVPRRIETVPKDFPVPTIQHGPHAGCVGVEGMVLMEMPLSRYRQFKNWVREKVRRQAQSVRENVFRVHNDGDAFGPIQMQNRVTVQKSSRPVEIAEDQEI